MTRAQMEIFGLVVIVILMSLGLLFAVVVLTKDSTQEVSRVKKSLEAANFLNAMLGATAPNCDRRLMRQLLQDCALGSVVDRQLQGVSLCEDDMPTCDKFKIVMSDMLNRSLGEWGRSYSLSFQGADTLELINLSSGVCRGEREASTRPEVVRPKFTVNVTLYLCQE